VYFSPTDNGIVYTIAPSLERVTRGPFAEWNWQAHQPASGTLRPIADAAGRSRFGVNPSHVFGRLRIASVGGIDVAILVRHVDSPVYAWRLN
jgi:coproporphyrinogen III oxidase